MLVADFRIIGLGRGRSCFPDAPAIANAPAIADAAGVIVFDVFAGTDIGEGPARAAVEESLPTTISEGDVGAHPWREPLLLSLVDPEISSTEARPRASLLRGR